MEKFDHFMYECSGKLIYIYIKSRWLANKEIKGELSGELKCKKLQKRKLLHIFLPGCTKWVIF